MDAVNADGWRDVLARCAAALARVGGEAWLTGGGVRDALLGHSPRDLDLVVTADPWSLARLLAPLGAPGAVILLRETHRTVRVVLPVGDTNAMAQVDLAPLRGGALSADLGARDFTINAMAWPLAARDAFVALLAARPTSAGPDTTPLVDPLGGLADLRARRLCAASATALADDPVRVVRGARLVAALDLTPDAATLARIRVAASALAREPVERVRDEFWGILALDDVARAARGLALLQETGALGAVLPELAASSAHPGPDHPDADHPDADTGSTSDARLTHAVQTVAALAAARDALATHAPNRRQQALRAWLDAWEAQPLAAGRPRRVALRWAALLHALESGANDGVNATGTGPGIFKRMGLAKSERALARTVARSLSLSDPSLPGHLSRDHTDGAPDADDLRAARRFFAATGEAGIETLLVATACALAVAEHSSRHPPPVGAGEPEGAPTRPARDGQGVVEVGRAARWIGRFAWERDTAIPPPLVDGPALIAALGIAPGPEIGKLLGAIRQAQIDGEIEQADQALALARRLLGG